MLTLLFNQPIAVTGSASGYKLGAKRPSVTRPKKAVARTSSFDIRAGQAIGKHGKPIRATALHGTVSVSGPSIQAARGAALPVSTSTASLHIHHGRAGALGGMPEEYSLLGMDTYLEGFL